MSSHGGGDHEGKNRLRVAYIAGTARSGSTLLETILGAAPNAMPLGEVRWIWYDNWSSFLCQCGQPVGECPFWCAVLDEACDGRDVDEFRAAVGATTQKILRHRYAASPTAWSTGENIEFLGDAYSRVYEAAATVSGADLVIDESKGPKWAMPTAAGSTIDLRVIHLVRDPCAVAYSYRRRKATPYLPGQEIPPASTKQCIIDWIVLNAEAELLKRRVRKSTLVLYERFSTETLSELDRIVAFLGLDCSASELLASERVVQGHAIAGNPMRYDPSPLVVKPDNAWQDELPQQVRWTVRACTALQWAYYRTRSMSPVSE